MDQDEISSVDNMEKLVNWRRLLDTGTVPRQIFGITDARAAAMVLASEDLVTKNNLNTGTAYGGHRKPPTPTPKPQQPPGWTRGPWALGLYRRWANGVRHGLMMRTLT